MSYSESQSTNNQFPAEKPVKVFSDENAKPNINMWEYLGPDGKYNGPFSSFDMDCKNQNGDFKSDNVTQVKCGSFQLQLKEEDQDKVDFFENIEVDEKADNDLQNMFINDNTDQQKTIIAEKVPLSDDINAKPVDGEFNEDQIQDLKKQKNETEKPKTDKADQYNPDQFDYEYWQFGLDGPTQNNNQQKNNQEVNYSKLPLQSNQTYNQANIQFMEQFKQNILRQINQNSKHEPKFDTFDELVEYLTNEKDQKIICLSHIIFQKVANQCALPENECKQKLLTFLGKEQYKNIAMPEFKKWLLSAINIFLKNKRDFVRHPQSEDLINNPLKEALINHQKFLSEGKSVDLRLKYFIAEQLGLTEDDIGNMIRTLKDNELYEWPNDKVLEIKTKADQLWRESKQKHPEYSNQDRKEQVMEKLNLDQYKQYYWCSPKKLSKAIDYYLALKEEKSNINMWEYLGPDGKYNGPFSSFDMDCKNQNGDFKSDNVTQVKCGSFQLQLKEEDYDKVDFFENIEVEGQAGPDNNPQPQDPGQNNKPNKSDPYDLESNQKFQEEGKQMDSDSCESVEDVIMGDFSNKIIQTGKNTVQNDLVFSKQITNEKNCNKQTQVEAINEDLVFTKNNIRYEKTLTKEELDAITTKETLIKNALPKFKELILEAINGFFKITPKFVAFVTESLKNALKFYKWYNSEVQIINLDFESIAAQLNLTETDISSMFSKLQCELPQYNEERAIYNQLSENIKQLLSNKIIQLWYEHLQLSVERITIIQNYIQLQLNYAKSCNSVEQKKRIEQQDAIFQHYKSKFVKNDIEQLFSSLSVSPSREKFIETELQKRRLKEDKQFVDYNFNIYRDVQAVEVGDHAGVRIPIIKKEQKDQKESIFAPGAGDSKHNQNPDFNPEAGKNETEKPKIDKAHDYFTDPDNPDAFNQFKDVFDNEYWYFDEEPIQNNNQQNNPAPNYHEPNQFNIQFMEQRDVPPQNNQQQNIQPPNNQPVQKNKKAENQQQTNDIPQSIDTNTEQNAKNVQNTEQNTIDTNNTQPGTEKTTKKQKWSESQLNKFKENILRQIDTLMATKFSSFDELLEHLYSKVKEQENEQQIDLKSQIDFKEVAKECGQSEDECLKKYTELCIIHLAVESINNSFKELQLNEYQGNTDQDTISKYRKYLWKNPEKQSRIKLKFKEIGIQLGLTEQRVGEIFRNLQEHNLDDLDEDTKQAVEKRANELWKSQWQSQLSIEERRKELNNQLRQEFNFKQSTFKPKQISNFLYYLVNTFN
ncbi:GYF-like_domain superfamily [Hexamita inflata]|uniref:GYF-like domain superfamily n=1 Tax=Hexamita inflata TaxID=28002 RepID=A0AA86US33_9EUKA|nr:GYF-like domain superfamily [Hexamita inflata]